MSHAVQEGANRKLRADRGISSAEAVKILKGKVDELSTLRLMLKAAEARRRHFG